MQPRGAVLIGSLTAEDEFVLQIAHEIVVHFGRLEGHIGGGGLAF